MFSGFADQAHNIPNAFNVLFHEGFLYGQGVLTLEAVQKFYKTISETPRKADLVVKELIGLCPPGKEVQLYQAVIRLRYENSRTNEIYYHAVAVKESNLEGNSLTLTVLDSLAGEKNNGITTITVPVYNQGGRKHLQVGGEKDKWCLNDKNCYYLCF